MRLPEFLYHLTMPPKRIAIISTGGTIEKTYNELSGVLSNQLSVLDVMLASLEVHGIEINRVPLMNKDSLDMDEADHTVIAQTALTQAADHDGVFHALEHEKRHRIKPRTLQRAKKHSGPGSWALM